VDHSVTQEPAGAVGFGSNCTPRDASQQRRFPLVLHLVDFERGHKGIGHQEGSPLGPRRTLWYAPLARNTLYLEGTT
jgi:hypothetical protein